MATVQETLDVLSTVQMLVGLVNGKMDAIITKIQGLQASGGVFTQVELDGLAALATAVRDAAQLVDQKADQALAL